MRAFPAALLAASLLLLGCTVDQGRAASAQQAVQVQETELDFRRVWAGPFPNFYASEPSPDGRYVSEIDWTGGDLAVRDLVTGDLELVTNKKTWADSADYAEYSAFSPDGQRLAYTWSSDSKDGYEVREIGLDGTGMRTLVEAHPDLRYLAVEDYAPDGSEVLLTVFRSDRSSSIATVPTDGGPMRVLKTSDWRHPFVARYSPDSRSIAFDFKPDEDDRQRDIFLMPVDGSRETALVEGPSHDILMGWLPDGSGILFYSDRSHTRGVWRQRVRDGRPVGEPELLAGDVWQLHPLGFGDGGFYYGVNVESPQVHTAAVDLTEGRVLTRPAAVSPASEGSTGYGAWSPDDRFLAYVLERPGDRPQLVIRSAAGEETREIPIDLNRPRQLQWHPDGGSLLMVGVDTEGRQGVHRVDVRTGERTPFFIPDDPSKVNGQGGFRIAPDGRTLLVKLVPDDRKDTELRRVLDVAAVDVTTGDVRILHRVQSQDRSSLSPDGRFYATRGQAEDGGSWPRAIKIGRTDGTGELRTIFISETAIHPQSGHPWTPDGRHVLVPEQFECEGPNAAECELMGSRILKVPVDGGEPTVLLELEGQIRGLELSPDGRRISFRTGNSLGEIWRMDGFSLSGGSAAANEAGAR